MSESRDESARKTFRALVERADKKFARVRDLPPYGTAAAQGHLFPKAFKAYMRLWKFQQENRQSLVESGLNRWEIGEIASRIGQLYFSQYMRTSEARFLVEAYIFYEAILSRKYFEGSGPKAKDLGVRAKELRFYARFLLVALILNRTEMVKMLVEKFKAVIDDCEATFRETNFREWKIVLKEIVRFMKVDSAFTSDCPLRYCPSFDSHSASLPYVFRFHAKKVLKFRDAILTSYHRNEVKYAELTLDSHRMLQCLEWEPSASFYRKRSADSNENGGFVDHSAASGLIEMNLPDMSDPSLPPNPKKAILYRPSVTHLIAVIATVCEELPPESVILIYLSAPGKPSGQNTSQIESSGGSTKSSKSMISSETSHCSTSGSDVDGQKMSSCHNSCLWLGPKGSGGSNTLYPADIIPFTRRPLFLIIDSDNSQAFKVIHGAERGETAALFLSPLRPSFRNLSDAAQIENGSQFTYFLTAPLLAFRQMAGLSSSDINPVLSPTFDVD
ncbi:hypothetical protein CDL15_Pgr001754 [Punica granatum]|uniref:Protein SCAI n=1 Tax=Punica granatum TaxID=22663 RepID=A0A218XBU1_PUNGR|nr:hypothetical protein CDL15_Pgr001754 [Punica granatum]